MPKYELSSNVKSTPVYKDRKEYEEARQKFYESLLPGFKKCGLASTKSAQRAKETLIL